MISTIGGKIHVIGLVVISSYSLKEIVDKEVEHCWGQELTFVASFARPLTSQSIIS